MRHARVRTTALLAHNRGISTSQITMLHRFAERFGLRSAEHFRYLSQGSCTRIDGVDDAKDFHTLTV